ncbi:MAG: hypothetical protein H0V30_14815 [Chitinophagaceae bacterium]|jgi:hypothetical protein|nr:hypothetical protein [Chitinophagaceae bacterium]
MKKQLIVGVISLLSFSMLHAQDENDEEQKGFKKENLFTGGSVSLSFGNNTFLIGGTPVFGYSLTKWIDAGIAVNFNYTSYRDYQLFNDRLRQTIYGGGVFTRIYPVRFLFAQAQLEHNFIKQKYLPPNNGTPVTQDRDATSFLVGAGYTTNRNPGSGQSFFYVSVLVDLMKNEFSPYRDNANRVLPIIRAGVQIPLFQNADRYNTY